MRALTHPPLLLIGAALLGGSAPPATIIVLDQPRPHLTERFRITTGARVEPSGFLTVEQAPASSPAVTARSPKARPNPRDHRSNLRSIDRRSRVPRNQLQKLAQPWIDRFAGERLFTGYGLNARDGTADIDMVVSEKEFAAIAARRGWGRTPEFLRLRFDEAPIGPAVAVSIANGLRIFAHSDRNLGLHHQAALSGRIIVRDGCFRVAGFDGNQQLAYFPREVGVYVDPQGYLALRTRTAEPRHLGRIGEQFTWAGPIGIDEKSPMVAELRRQCGTAPLMHLAVPESSAVFNARYGLPRTPPPPPPPPPPR
ncbi:MAG: hypothetical protein ABIS38_09935 [Sphingomicrobium sp.]